jgi:energy-converting hydrogenase Eha subunit A
MDLHHFKHGFMAFLSVPVAAIGLDAWLSRATSVIGLYTAVAGAVVGTCGAIWWLKKLFRGDKNLT